MFVNKYGKYLDKPTKHSIDLVGLSLSTVLEQYDTMWKVHPDYVPEYDFTRKDIASVKSYLDIYKFNNSITLPTHIKFIFEEFNIIETHKDFQNRFKANLTEITDNITDNIKVDNRKILAKLLNKKESSTSVNTKNKPKSNTDQLTLFD